MDSAIIPLANHKNLALVQTVDFFYPLVDDPVVMGKIALANVVSDMYAVGVENIDKLTLIISAPTELSEKQRDVIIPAILSGFKNLAEKAECKFQVQNIAVNPWCMIGGVATSVCTRSEMIVPTGAQSGDVLILTKPLGTQLATNAYLWMKEGNDKFNMLAEKFTKEDIEETFMTSIKSMTFLNKIGANLMHKYSANAATDVTGFGLLGHAENLAKFQNANLKFIISKLPIIKNVKKMSETVNQSKKLLSGMAVETSGGLLICLPEMNGQKFCDDYRKSTNNEQKAWIVGHVVENGCDKCAVLNDEIEYIDVEL